MYNPPSWNDHSVSGTRQCISGLYHRPLLAACMWY